jgi:VanZ like family/Concanavalin A-like lectin/glucanases superfamily
VTRSSSRLHLQPLALAVIVFGTVVPVELRAPVTWWLLVDAEDFLFNVLLYAPLGLCLWRRPVVVGVAVGAVLSSAIEILQVWYFGRYGTLLDIAGNMAGVAFGVIVGRWLARSRHFDPVSLPIDWRSGALAAIGAAGLAFAWTLPSRPSTIANWDSGFALLLGNEQTSDRPWRGTIAALALVPQSLTSAELRALSKLSDPAVRDALLQRGAYVLPQPMTLNGSTAIRLPPEASRRFHDLAVERNAFAVIATLATADVEQDGPARVLSYSRDTYNRNFTLAQDGGRLHFRVRTSVTGPNGMNPHTETPPLLEPGQPVTVAATFDGAAARVYVDGRARGRQNLAAAGCVIPVACDSHVPITTALFGALLAIVAIAAGTPCSRRQAIGPVTLAAAAGAVLALVLDVGRGTLFFGGGATLLVFAGAACVLVSLFDATGHDGPSKAEIS